MLRVRIAWSSVGSSYMIASVEVTLVQTQTADYSYNTTGVKVIPLLRFAPLGSARHLRWLPGFSPRAPFLFAWQSSASSVREAVGLSADDLYSDWRE